MGFNCSQHKKTPENHLARKEGFFKKSAKATWRSKKRQNSVEHELSPTIPWIAEEEEKPPEISEAKCHEAEEPTHETIEEPKDSSCKSFWIGHSEQTIFQVSFEGNPTVGQATQAEAKLHELPVTIKPMNGVGGDLSLSQTVQTEDVILIRQCGQCDKDKCYRQNCNHRFAPEGNGVPSFPPQLTREELLWNQRGWVATDEMTFYLRTLKNEGQVNTSPPLYFDDVVSQILVWGDWVVRASEIASATNQKFDICTVVWHDHHWFPVRIEVKEREIAITTTPMESELLHELSKEAFGDYNFVIQVMDIHHKFPADCGFQAIAWLIALAREQPRSTCINATEALSMRKQFAHYLREQAIHDRRCPEIKLGGMNHAVASKELQKLLEEHGVSSQRVKEHAQYVYRKDNNGRNH